MNNLFENIQIFAELEFLISGMEISLNEAKLSNPNKSFVESEKRCKNLRKFQSEFLEMAEEVRIMDKKYNKVLSENQKYEIAFDDICKKLKDVETERDNLKKDIIL